MADREDNVYKGKLAEQAERYDGMFCNLLYNKPFKRYTKQKFVYLCS